MRCLPMPRRRQAAPVYDAQAVAALTVCDVLHQGRSLDRALAARMEGLPQARHALLRELARGTLRWHPYLLAMLVPLLRRPLAHQDPRIVGLLLVASYQLDHSKLPCHAVVQQAVEACLPLGQSWAKPLVNGVLRTRLRRHDALHDSLRWHERDALPLWLAERLRKEWPAHYEDIAASARQRPPMALRVSTPHCERPAYMAQLTDAGIPCRPCALSPSGVWLEEAWPPPKLPGFGDGQASVQDESAQLAAPLLAVRDGERVLDACAAPGGKSSHLLELAPEMAELTMLDIDEGRLQLLRDNLGRLGLPTAGTALRHIAADAAHPEDWWDQKPYDRILLDVPCSGTGVMRRRPDIKWLRRPEDIPRFAALQLRLLRALWPCLRPGGELLYVSCSLLDEENGTVVQRFLAREPEAQACQLPVDWGHASGPGRAITPMPTGGDGFFFALLRRAH